MKEQANAGEMWTGGEKQKERMKEKCERENQTVAGHEAGRVRFLLLGHTSLRKQIPAH